MIDEDRGHLCLKEIIPIFRDFAKMVSKTLSVQDFIKEIIPENIKLFEPNVQPVA